MPMIGTGSAGITYMPIYGGLRYPETEELNIAFKEEMAKTGLAVCCLLRDHYAAIHKQNNIIMVKFGNTDKQIHYLIESAEDPTNT